jgi:hypothetical protein
LIVDDVDVGTGTCKQAASHEEDPGDVAIEWNGEEWRRREQAGSDAHDPGRA